MEFKRKKKRGQNQKVRRTWFSQEGYRIVWRKEVWGVRVPARFQACVRLLIPCYGGDPKVTLPIWDFVNPHRRLHKTMKAAIEDCERHKRLWSKACEATGIRSLLEIFGKLPLGFPMWAKKKLNRKAYELLTRPCVGKQRGEDEEEACPETSTPAVASDPSDQPTASENTPARTTGSDVTTCGPASPAMGEDGTTTRRTRRARSKDTAMSEPSAVPPAKAAANGRKRRSRKRTTKPSKGGGRKRKSTTTSPEPATPRSRGSRKTKSRPSAS